MLLIFGTHGFLQYQSLSAQLLILVGRFPPNFTGMISDRFHCACHTAVWYKKNIFAELQLLMLLNSSMLKFASITPDTRM